MYNDVGCHNLVNSKVTTISRNSETVYVILKLNKRDIFNIKLYIRNYTLNSLNNVKCKKIYVVSNSDYKSFKEHLKIMKFCMYQNVIRISMFQ